MFTGLIEEVGRVTNIERLENAVRLSISSELVTSDAKRGDSIQVSGVCLTVVEHDDKSFTADVMQQTLSVSTLGDLSEGDSVNLERAVRADTRLGGHIVQGHVDGIAVLSAITEDPNWRVLRFNIGAELAPMLVDKGSVTVAGVSLTVSNLAEASEAEQWFEVSLIPETISTTTLGELAVGDRVNIETDIIARHVSRMLSFKEESK